jgi:adenosylhomocysteinase
MTGAPGDTVVAHEVADLDLADLGQRRIEWADRSMPVLSAIRQRFSHSRPLSGLRIAACMQVTAETANLMRTLSAGGAQVTIAASNPLSTQDDTAAALVRHLGLRVFAMSGVDHDTYRRHILAALSVRPHLLLDEGGDLVHAAHTAGAELAAETFAGCEATASGEIRLRQMAREGVLRIPVVAANDTPTRRMVDNRYGTGQSVLDGVLRASNILLAGRTVVISGYGACGVGLAERARGLGARVVVTEVDPVRALDAALQGYTVLPMAQAATIGDVFVTATGNREVVRAEHLRVMKDGALLANAGHFDVEIDVRALAALAVEVRTGVRPHADEYLLAGGRRLVLLGQGRVVNLTAAEGNPAASMDVSFADQALTVEWLVNRHDTLAPGVHPVPTEIDREVCRLTLASMGMQIDVLTEPQQEYLRSWREGAG